MARHHGGKVAGAPSKHWNCVRGYGGTMKMRKIRYIRETVRKYGVRATLHDIECRVVNKIAYFRILEGMTVRLQDVRDPTLFEAQGFDARFVGADELAKFAYEPAYNISVDFLHRTRVRGDRCYALFDGETLASYGWYSDLPTPIDEHFVLHFDPAGRTCTRATRCRLTAEGGCMRPGSAGCCGRSPKKARRA